MIAISVVLRPLVVTRIEYEAIPQAHAQVVDDRKVKITREMFSSVPILYEIAKCESTFRQYDETGQVLRGKVNSHDVGVLQINETYHGNEAKNLGYDIYSLRGNILMGEYLYSRFGTSPWNASKNCWGK